MTSVVRTLPIRLAPLPGEALDSWLAALAHRSAVDLRGILTAAGPSLSSRSGLAPDYTTYLTDEEAERLSWATGVPARRLHAMTLRQYDGRALALMAQRRLVQRFTLWGRSIGSRYCPQCLAEQGGRWPLRWRLTWSMACTRHRVLLAHTCATCGARPHSRSSLASRVHPRKCSARKPSDGSDLGASGVFCGADLTEAAVLVLAPDSPVLAAQEWIDDLLTQAEGEAGGDRLRSVFGDLAVVASRVLLRAEPGDFQLYGQKIDQARVAYGNDWRYAPVDAAVLAGPLTRAVEIVRDYSSDASLTAARMLADRDAAATNKPTVDRVRGRTRIGSSSLEGLFWRGVDHRLDTRVRLRYRTCTTQPRIPIPDDPVIETRARSLPQLLWRDWTLALFPPLPTASGRHPDHRHYRAALSSAVLLPGWWLGRSAPLIAMLHGQRRVPIARLLAKLPDTDALAAICLLADHLDRTPAPIDYQRRRTLTGAGLLPEDAWSDIRHRSGTPPDERYRLPQVRRFLLQRITGSDPYAVPGPQRLPNGAREPMLILTTALLTALDDHATNYLAARGINEPVTWSPPLALVSHLDLPGRRTGDLDTALAANLVRNRQMSPAAAARELGTTVEHLRFAFETRPELCTSPPATSSSA